MTSNPLEVELQEAACCGCWGLDLGPLQEHTMLLTADSSSSPDTGSYALTKHFSCLLAYTDSYNCPVLWVFLSPGVVNKMPLLEAEASGVASIRLP